MKQQQGRVRRALRPLRFVSLLRLVLPATLLFAPAGALAQLAASASAIGQDQYNSNVFDLQRGFPSGPNDYDQADHYYAYGAGLDLSDQISQQNLYLRGTDTEFVYNHFTQLTHDEYTGDAGWAWKLGHALNGTLDVQRSRTMVAFTEVVQLLLAIDTDQRETATLGLQVTPRWRVDTNAYADRLLEPLPGEPNLRLSDSGAGAALKYLGTAEWTGGLSGDYQHGDYSGSNGVFSPSYNQWTYALVATYQPSAPSGSGGAIGAGTGPAGASTFDFAAGYTDRVSVSDINNIRGATGHLDYNDQLTGKTALKLALSRLINSYLTNAGSEIDTSAGISAVWQATYKIGVTVGYSWIYRDLPQQGFVTGTNRNDHLQLANFNIEYRPASWLSIQPYANFQTRHSNYYGADFNATMYGVSLTVRWQNATAAANK